MRTHSCTWTIGLCDCDKKIAGKNWRHPVHQYFESIRKLVDAGVSQAGYCKPAVPHPSGLADWLRGCFRAHNAQLSQMQLCTCMPTTSMPSSQWVAVHHWAEELVIGDPSYNPSVVLSMKL